MEAYDEQWAANYQRLAAAAIPGREGLYRLCSACMSRLPENARILVVGCGTGEELVLLASTLPYAEFEAIDPSEAMLKVCAGIVEKQQLTDRINLHHSTLEEFSSKRPFDAATSILVSQHITSDTLAQDYFNQIAAILKPGGLLYSADMHISNGQNQESLIQLWHRNLIMSGIDSDLADGMRSKIQSEITIRKEKMVSGFLENAGFENILRPFSSLLYGAWSASKRFELNE